MSLIQGGRSTTELLIDHPAVRAVSFVGSTPVAHSVYARVAAAGKRGQAQGGAKNALVLLPDVPIEAVAAIAAESAFGNAGQRCLAGASMIAVGSAADPFAEAISELARSWTIGSGLVEGVELGPVHHRSERGADRGPDRPRWQRGRQGPRRRRGTSVPGYEKGFYVGATVLDRVE